MAAISCAHTTPSSQSTPKAAREWDRHYLVYAPEFRNESADAVSVTVLYHPFTPDGTSGSASLPFVLSDGSSVKLYLYDAGREGFSGPVMDARLGPAERLREAGKEAGTLVRLEPAAGRRTSEEADLHRLIYTFRRGPDGLTVAHEHPGHK
jgi:hypothetical protein